MERKGYEPYYNENVSIVGCATCKHARYRLSEREIKELKYSNKCKGAKVVELPDGTVMVTSECSGESNVYPRKLIVIGNEKKDREEGE